jgi:uncharacterized membrane protein YhaH (DUF805 family)
MHRYGRLNRATYFLGFAILVAAYVVMAQFMTRPPAVGEILAASIAVPRLHDIGKSGWWAGGVILAELVVVFGALPFAISTHDSDVILIAGGLFVFVVLGLMVWLGCIAGQTQANRYGEPPPPGISLKTYGAPKA